jgi:hypothetical protein
MILLFLAVVSSFILLLVVGIGYMVYDMFKHKNRPTWTSSTDFSDPEDHSGGGGVAR